jgi:hypothetical protein
MALVRAEIPFHDKKDPMAAMRFSGPAIEVVEVREKVESILEDYKQQLHQCTLLVNSRQFGMVRGDDFRIIKSIQKRFGVFVNASGGKSSTRRTHDLGEIDARLTARGEVIEEDDSVLGEEILYHDSQVHGQSGEYGILGRDLLLSPCSTASNNPPIPHDFEDLDVVNYACLEQV